MTTKKPKPIVLNTREAMEVHVSDYVRLELHHARLTAEMEMEKAAIEQRYASKLSRLASEMELAFASIHNYCATHRTDLVTPQRKSFETVNATVGFRDTPPAVEKVRTRETWESVALRLQSLVFKHPDTQEIVLDCSSYVRERAPEVDKSALLNDRIKLSPEQLNVMGLRFSQEEHFYIEPKSDIAEGDSTSEPATVSTK